ncbi:heme-thiolate peroxidase [Pleurotus ostreatus PC15]|uniref:Heme-thiolate peroxidase n=1 Tax=Pleurotus ostreatus (strain PC15) TaxID=1137138 RepID=A0A067NKZ5_PLEO1|nr:heme-thiolate peroxidase [Pleurotus ostreatus PC15]
MFTRSAKFVVVAILLGVLTTVRSFAPQAPLIASVQHPYVPPTTDDDRSPCPALNALANHGYLPHDGRHITHSQLFHGLIDGFGLSYPLATLLTFGGYTLLRQVPPLSLLDISRVNGVEHNCSLAHNDIPWDHEYPRLHVTADVCLLNKLFADSSDQRTLSIEDVARARVRRESSPEYKNANVTLDALHAEIARGEMALVLGIFGDSNEVSLDFLKRFFLNEQLPDNWHPRATQGLVKTARTARKIRAHMDSLRKQ